MAPPYNTPGLQLEEMALDSRPREVSDAFLLSSATFFQFHGQIDVVLVRVTEGNGRNEGTVPFIQSEGYRACAFWRKALIG